MKLGIALISFDRPYYFIQLIKSLEEQVACGDLDFHLFQDGAVNQFSHILKTNPELLEECIDVFDNSRLENKIKHISKMNLGNAINQFQALEYMSDNYDYFLVIEDDVILSPFYIRLIRIMIDQFLVKNDVFSVALNFKRMCDKADIKDNLYKAGYDLHFAGSISLHWWAECFSSKKWKQVKPYFMQYYKYVNNCDYQRRPTTAIRKFFKENWLPIPQTSQDAGKDFAVKKAKLKRVNSIVNRGFYIGEQGMHFSPNLYNKMGYAEQKPFIFNSDYTLKKFIKI